MGQSKPFKWTLDTAHSFWSEWADKSAEEEGVGARFWSAELYILKHQPVSLAEAVCQLEVARDNFVAGGRCDGLDVAVLDRAMKLMRDQVVQDAIVETTVAHSPAN